MKICNCEHWQQCPICMPHRFDANGNLLPPEPTPLQAARTRIEELEREVERFKEDHGQACLLVAKMHAAAVGEITGPKRGVVEDVEDLRRELRETEIRLHDVATLCATVEQERDTAWAQAHRLAMELECLIMDTKDNAIVSKWWDSAFEAIEEYNTLKPGAAEDAEAWSKMRKAWI